jgi:putative DNA primase/helicase
LKNTNKFKGLTGRSLITASRKFLKGINFINYAKFIFACNELPMIYDNTKGFWGRWEVFEFPYTFVTQSELDSSIDKTNLKLRDEQIIDKITTEVEMSGLLNEFLKGLDRLMKNRDFTSTKGSDEIKNWWMRKSNSVMAFCEENITEEYDQTIIKKEFRSKYNQFCNDHKLVKMSDRVINETLNKTYGASEDRIEIMGTQSYVWSGIRWKRASDIKIKPIISVNQEIRTENNQITLGNTVFNPMGTEKENSLFLSNQKVAL